MLNEPQSARAEALRLKAEFQRETLTRGGLSLNDRQAIERGLELTLGSLTDAETREADRTLVAPIPGRLVWNGAVPPRPGSFVYRGDRLGRILAPDAMEIVLSFPAAYAGFIPARGLPVELRFPNGNVLVQSVSRARVVDVGQQAPAELLSSGGGRIPEIPSAPGNALDAAVVAWVTPDVDLSDQASMRVRAKIVLPQSTMFEQLGFHLRRLFLRVTRV